MKVRISDEQDVASLTPRTIWLYLEGQGWQRQTEETPAAPDVWTLSTKDGTYEVIAPSSRDTRDFAQRVAELLRTLAIAGDRSERDVLRELTTAAFDVQSVHTHFSSPSGTAPLRDAANAFAAAHAMLSASTASLDRPQLMLPSRPPRRTSELMKRVLAGPTGAGSYVISIMVPVPPLPPQDDLAHLHDESEPFERTATKHLHGALVAARAAANDALDKGTVIDAFLSREELGISANLCKALADLAGEEAVGFDVHFSWTPYRPVDGLESTISFRDATIPILRQASHELRTSLPKGEVVIVGRVIHLHRETHHGNGRVTISGSVVGDTLRKSRRVWVNLAESDYELAIQAHHSSADVQVIGLLEQRGTRTYLTHTWGFLF